MDIRELVLQMRQSDTDRAVQRATGVHRQTVKRYRAWATEQGLLSDAPLPALAALQKLVDATLSEAKPPQNTSSVEAHRATVLQMQRPLGKQNLPAYGLSTPSATVTVTTADGDVVWQAGAFDDVSKTYVVKASSSDYYVRATDDAVRDLVGKGRQDLLAVPATPTTLPTK